MAGVVGSIKEFLDWNRYMSVSVSLWAFVIAYTTVFNDAILEHCNDLGFALFILGMMIALLGSVGECITDFKATKRWRVKMNRWKNAQPIIAQTLQEKLSSKKQKPMNASASSLASDVMLRTCKAPVYKGPSMKYCINSEYEELLRRYPSLWRVVVAHTIRFLSNLFLFFVLVIIGAVPWVALPRNNDPANGGICPTNGWVGPGDCRCWIDVETLVLVGSISFLVSLVFIVIRLFALSYPPKKKMKLQDGEDTAPPSSFMTSEADSKLAASADPAPNNKGKDVLELPEVSSQDSKDKQYKKEDKN